jgi:hypothetical protein
MHAYNLSRFSTKPNAPLLKMKACFFKNRKLTDLSGSQFMAAIDKATYKP